MFQQKVTLSDNVKECLDQVINACPHDKLFVLADEYTARLCLPLIQNQEYLDKAECIIIGATDTNKTLDSLSYVWKELSDKGGTRHSLMLNVGGGMVTDLGGFAASTFKRGITYINIPTTLLAMVDASVGGKTGINFNGLKNEIGVFNPAKTVLIDTNFLRTLDSQNIFSGYAEMLKHGLISTKEHWADLLNFNLNDIDYTSLQTLVAHSIGIKENIVKQDPLERGIRKALNLGHTVGHAFESLALEENRSHLHGYAVAWGLVCELYLSHLKVGFPIDKMRQTIQFIRETYGVFPFECKQYNRLYEFMTHDKKNTSNSINFTLLSDIGDIHINQTATQKEIEEMLDFYRETMG
ncbi:MAG: 3-dehydroquinate synthase [Bacteroidaceae bacterium]|nr:3-dehydroquinate synthase [Bacteroidaceae bacterium]